MATPEGRADRDCSSSDQGDADDEDEEDSDDDDSDDDEDTGDNTSVAMSDEEDVGDYEKLITLCCMMTRSRTSTNIWMP